MKDILLKQLKALAGGGISVVPILALVEYLNTAFNMGMTTGAMSALAGLLILLTYAAIYYIPNIDPNLIKVDEVDVEGALVEAAKGYDIPLEVVEGMSNVVTDVLRGMRDKKAVGDETA